jgi:DNA-binding NarL/FixJ family response regulator
MPESSREVLIVDDSVTVRAAIRTFLEVNMQMRVCGEAGNGLEAIEIANERKPGLVLMDLAMPTMNGVEAASVIKKRAPETRIIVFTLHSESMGKSMAKAAGVDLVISKSKGASGLMEALIPLLAEDSASLH